MNETLTVKQLCTTVERVISSTFAEEVWVEGVISSLTRSANGHVYFDLIDPDSDLGSSTKAVVPVTLFSSAKVFVNKILKRSGGDTRMADGIKIRIRGKVSYYPPQGRIQLIMSLIDPEYILGQMAADRQKLLKELTTSGLLNKNSALKVPLLPLSVALVTSNQSAAHADFSAQLEASEYPFQVALYDCRMQGLEAVGGLVEAIEKINKEMFDVLVIVRGGGSRSDLVTFDHKEVAYAIATAELPVITGIGHEIDRSVADEVAHTSVKTPTAAAALLVQKIEATRNRVDQAEHRLHKAAQRHLEQADMFLKNQVRLLKNSARQSLQTADTSLQTKEKMLRVSATSVLGNQEQKLLTSASRLKAFDPKESLKRGWTITHNSKGKIIRSVEDVSGGEEIKTTTTNGVIASRIEKK